MNSIKQFEGGRFSKESYIENDLFGKQALVAYLSSKGHIIKPESFIENYGIDIVTEYKGIKYNFEVEMKGTYFTNEFNFPFETVSFLGRKAKWKDTEYTYCIICGPSKAAIFCNSNVIFNDDYREIINIETSRRHGSDLFYRVPKKLCTFRTPKEFFKSNYKEVWEDLKKINVS